MVSIVNHRITWRSSLSFIGCLILFSVFFQICYDRMLQGGILPDVNWLKFTHSILYNLIPIVGISLTTGAIVWKTRLMSPLVLKLGVDLFLSLSIVLMINVLFAFIIRLPVNWGGTVFCMVLILVILEMLTYFRRLQLTLHRDELQQRELLHKRYELIKMKVNPHFLFNAFNQLYAILNIAPERGQHYVLSLSRYYRYLMNVAERTTVPLSEEKQYLGDYTDLMRQRFSDSVRVDVKGESPASAEIVPLSTQILLENVANPKRWNVPSASLRSGKRWPTVSSWLL